MAQKPLNTAALKRFAMRHASQNGSTHSARLDKLATERICQCQAQTCGLPAGTFLPQAPHYGSIGFLVTHAPNKEAAKASWA
jgi:hypothetical protein